MQQMDTAQEIYSVSELTRRIKLTLEQNQAFSGVWVKGEIYNLTYHSSGHIYFTLKDNNALISVSFFKYANRNLSFKLEEGMSIFARGNVTVFEKRGSYQLNVTEVKLEGIGELQKRIEQLKKKLSEEGVFDPAYKKALPFLPRRVGVVTSPTGAAIQDIVKVALRRFPNIEIVLAPAKVQGDDAPETIVRGIEELNKKKYGIDVIIAGRGGGSFEDLMPFNEEPVVRAFFNSEVPIISAVGHQIDHPLSDDAADMYAPTPSAAAELAVPVKQDLTDEIHYYLVRANNALSSLLSSYRDRVEAIEDKRIFRDPQELIAGRTLLMRDALTRLTGSMKEIIAEKRNILLQVPDVTQLTLHILQEKQHHYQMALQALDQLSPLNVMKRGYAIAKNEKGEVIKDTASLSIDETIDLNFVDGTARCTVNFVETGEFRGKKD